MGLFAKKTNTTITVEGMKCKHCVARVEDSLKALGVKAVANLETKEVSLSYDEAKISLDKIKETINELGFKA